MPTACWAWWLALARTQWVFYQSGLDGKDKANARRNVDATNERIFEVIDNLTGLYDAALKALPGGAAELYFAICHAGEYRVP